MAIWNRKSVIADAIDDWRERGLIDEDTAGRLSDDLSNLAPARSFSTIIVLLGVICLAFGVMTFVAANWQEMTSASRLALLIVSLWASWGAAVRLKSRGREWTSQAFILLACAIFGGSIMLLGQIYHLQGEPRDAVWLWMTGTVLAAMLVRSGMALALAAILITLWALMDTNLRAEDVEFTYLIYWLACAVIAWWLASRFAGHMLMAGMVVWLAFSAASYLRLDASGHELLFLQAAFSASLTTIAVLLFSGREWAAMAGFFRPAIVYAMLAAATMLALWYGVSEPGSVEYSQRSLASIWPGAIAVPVITGIAALSLREQVEGGFTYDIAVAAVMAAIATLLMVYAARLPFLAEAFLLAMSIWTIRMGWRMEFRPLAVIGWVGFAAAMLVIYARTVGTLLDTSLFYLGAGVLLLAGAAIAARLGRSADGTEAAK